MISKRKGEEKENVCEINENRKGKGTEQQGGIIRKRLGSVSIFSLSKIMKFILDAHFNKIYAVVNTQSVALQSYSAFVHFYAVKLHKNH